MATKAGDAFVNLGVRDQEYNRKMARGQKKLASFAGFATKAGIAIAAAWAGAKVVGALSRFTGLAADAEETASKFGVVFSGVADEAEQIAESFRVNFGVASSTSKKLLGDTGDLLGGFGFTDEAALKLSAQVNELAADLASFTNVEGGVTRASQALTKALLGERESAKELGIAIQEADVKGRLAAKGQKGLTGIALRQAKAVATLEIAVSQSKNAIGDFGRTFDSQANRAKVLTERWKEFSEALSGSLSELLNIKEIFASLTGLIIRMSDSLNKLKESGVFIKLSEQFKAFIKIWIVGFKAIFTLQRKLIPPLLKFAKIIGGVFEKLAEAIGEFARGGGLGKEIKKILAEMDANIKRRTGELGAGGAGGKKAGGGLDLGTDSKKKKTQFIGFAEAIKKAQQVSKGNETEKKMLVQSVKQTKAAEKTADNTSVLIDKFLAIASPVGA